MEADTTLERDWTRELVEAQERMGGKWFKAEDGIFYHVTFKDEGGAEYIQTFDGKELTKVDFQVEVNGGNYNGEQIIWSLTKGGLDSLWIKLATLFTENKGAAGYTVNVKANGEGRQRRYVVKEYNELTFSG